MSAPQGCTDDTAVVESFKEALKQRIGADRFRLWFTHGVEFFLEREPSSADSSARGDADAEVHSVAEAGSAASLLADAISAGAAISAGPTLGVAVRGRFALDRMRQNLMRELRGAAAQTGLGDVELRLSGGAERLAEITDANGTPPRVRPAARALRRARADGRTAGLGATAEIVAPPTEAAKPTNRNLADGPAVVVTGIPGAAEGATPGLAASARPAGACPASDHPSTDHPSADHPAGDHAAGDHAAGDHAAGAAAASSGAAGPLQGGTPTGSAESMTFRSFIPGPSNELAFTASKMCCQTPGAASPLLLVGTSGVGKTHLMSAIADHFRRGSRMRRVIRLSAEQFTNDFIKSVGTSGLPAFRRRYRDLDALLIDDVQFLATKKATLREMLYTIDTLASAGRPLVFTADRPPAEISGLTRELAGRMSAGLVCPMRPLDTTTRETLLRRLIAQHCPAAWPEEVIVEINGMLGGDGRMLRGIVNLVSTLQRMHRRMPTMDEIRQYGGELLRSQTPVVTLTAIERAVCEAFELDAQALRSGGQTRSISEPRMLAMYLSRQLTSSAFSEIARHYGGRSHTTALAANRKVASWLESGRSVGRGRQAMSARQAVERIESILRTG